MNRDELIDGEWECLTEMRRLQTLSNSLHEGSTQYAEVRAQWNTKRKEKWTLSALIAASKSTGEGE